jgi:hypothetical protein
MWDERFYTYTKQRVNITLSKYIIHFTPEFCYGNPIDRCLKHDVVGKGAELIINVCVAFGLHWHWNLRMAERQESRRKSDPAAWYISTDPCSSNAPGFENNASLSMYEAQKNNLQYGGNVCPYIPYSQLPNHSTLNGFKQNFFCDLVSSWRGCCPRRFYHTLYLYVIA